MFYEIEKKKNNKNNVSVSHCNHCIINIFWSKENNMTKIWCKICKVFNYCKCPGKLIELNPFEQIL
jgi:hypothetical protein